MNYYKKDLIKRLDCIIMQNRKTIQHLECTNQPQYEIDTREFDSIEDFMEDVINEFDAI